MPGDLQTLAASAGEGQLTAFYAAAGLAGHFAAEGFGNFHFRKIVHPSAAGTDEMHVGFGISVKAFHALDGSQTDDIALLLKQSQVPVHCTDTQIGDLRFQLGVYPVGAGVDIRSLNTGEDGVPLTEVLCSGPFHNCLLSGDE